MSVCLWVVNVQVVEIVNGDCLVVRMLDGSSNKIFLASIRSPRFVALRYHVIDYELRG